MHRLRQLIHEIHRRSLWQVLGIYLVGGWIAYEVVQSLTEGLGLPEWFPPFAIVLLIIGLPIVLATAFVQEGVGGSWEEATDVDATADIFTWRNALGGGLVAFALWGVVAAGWVVFGAATREPTGAGTSVDASVAVMPCDDLTPTGDQAALAQGLAEGIINALAQLPNLKVSGITSVIALRDDDADVQTVAETLDVATVLECGLQQADNVVRIRPRLVEAATGAVLWSDEIDRPAGNVFAIQDEVARAVTDRLQVVFTDGAGGPLVTRATTVPEAHEAYLRGRFFWNQRGQGLLAAIEEFERALELDPEYAEALSGLADSYALLAGNVSGQDWRTTRERALELAQRAVTLEPGLGMAHASLGYAQLRLGQWEDSEREFMRAIELNPGYTTAHHWFGVLLYFTGRADQAVIQITRAVALDPVSRAANRDLAAALWVAGRVDEADEQFRATIELDREYRAAQSNLLQLLILSGNYDEARDAEWMPLIDPDPATTRALAVAVAQYSATGEVRPYEVPPNYPLGQAARVRFYAATGQSQRALEIVESVSGERNFFALAATHSFIPDPLRNDPRYRALLEEAGITW